MDFTMGVVIALMHRLGVTHPSEQTMEWLIALSVTEHFIVNLKPSRHTHNKLALS